ncbi:MAG TPA: oligosaccharide flippase family protein [Ktedonobacterales bacterium]|jgi:O-antigen/teichoic acid export membrane protein
MLSADTPISRRQHVRSYLSLSALSGAGQVLARVLGVLFSVVVARAFGPADFGVVRYAIGVAGIASIVVGPLPTMLSRYLAIYRNESREVDRYFTNGAVLIAVILLFTLLGTGWYLQGEPPGIVLGTLLVVIGLAVFNTYTELTRGLDALWRMASYYVVANLLQLIAIVVCVWCLRLRSVGLALAIYGLSSLLPIVFFEFRRRSSVHLRLRLLTLPTMWRLSHFSVPLVIAHASYTIWGTLDLLLVEQHLGAQDTGVYGAAKTIVLVFLFVPFAVTTVALRYFARGSKRDAERSLLLSLGASLVTSAALVAGIWGWSGRLVQVMFGQNYRSAAQSLIILAAGMAAYTVYLVFETWMVARGYPWFHALAMTLTMGIGCVAELALLPSWGLQGVAAGFSLGIAAGTLTIIAFYLLLTKHPALAGSKSVEKG